MANNFSALGKMIYSGRGITIGMTQNGNSFIGYTLTGRSPSSQARKLVYDEGNQVVRIEVTDPEQLRKGNTALLVYPAIAHLDGRLIASNGIQTELIYTTAKGSGFTNPLDILQSAMSRESPRYDPQNGWLDITSFEPDKPNFTPRISGFLNNEGIGALHIVRNYKGRKEPELFPGRITKGEAATITTYKGGNENPLLPFEGNLLVGTVDSNESNVICWDLYNAIGAPNPLDGNKVYRVAAAVMMMKKSGGLEAFTVNRDEVGT